MSLRALNVSQPMCCNAGLKQPLSGPVYINVIYDKKYKLHIYCLCPCMPRKHMLLDTYTFMANLHLVVLKIWPN